MKISKQQLIEMSACKSGLDRFIAQTGGTDEPVEVTSLIGGENTYSDLLWLAGKTLPKEKIVRFACDCALITIEKIKPYCSESDYQLITSFLNNPTYDATHAARAEVDSAYDAYASAVNGVLDTVYNAYDAVYNAYDAVYDDNVYTTNYESAANAAYAANTHDSVNDLLVKLFTEEV